MTEPIGIDRALAWAEEAGIPPEEVGLVSRLLRVNMFVEQLLEQIVEPHGISVADSMVLASMRRGRSSPVELCRVLRRTTGGMSLTLDRLVAAGWVKRVPDPADRRRIIVKLTPKGRRKSENIHRALHGWEDGLGLTPAEDDEIGRVLDHVALLLAGSPD